MATLHRPLLFVPLLAAAAVWVALPQAPKAPQSAGSGDDQVTFKSEVDLVNVMCSVRNKQGGLVGSLTKDDFAVLEDGKQQTLRYFTRESDLPLTIGLLVDVSRSQERLIDIEKSAASQFFSALLRKKDMAFLISFGSEAELLQDLTGSPKLLRSGLEQLRVNSDVGGVLPGPVPTASHPRGTVLYDAVYLAANEKLKGEVGRKVLVLITDGMDQGSRLKIQDAIEAAQRSDAIIYSLYYVDPAAYGYFGASDSALKRMSEETGGHLFRIDRKHTLEDAFQQIQEEMRTQYALAYAPANQVKDGSFRRVEIRLSQKDLKVQARKGYYAGKG
jgi:VWFA-related protein